MSPPGIKVENLSKQYRLGQVGTGSLSHDINRLWHKVRGNEDPYLKIGEENNRETKGSSDYVWALKDINFDIQQGDRVGIIGRNGAGKSTLLKILSRTTSPTTGSVKIKGKVASLLEVGTGFHPDLSGRDNIFLNGAILGMSKRDIKSRFDEIVDFAGVERYIDTPVKRYSSGMYVRLAFAVAAHLESDILIVDEVLAVGDAEFQKKCLGKMGEVSEGQGKTILFVSHNMGALMQLCQKAILLKNGNLNIYSTTNNVIEKYLQANQKWGLGYEAKETSRNLYIKSVATKKTTGAETDNFRFDEEIILDIVLCVKHYNSMTKLSVTLQNSLGDFLSTFVEDLSSITNKLNDSLQIRYKLPHSLITPNTYSFRFALFIPNSQVFDLIELVCPIRVVDSGTQMAIFEGINYGNFAMKYTRL